MAAARRHERGRAVYNFRCYFCHGYSGDARTLAASYLTPEAARLHGRRRAWTPPASPTLRAGRPGTAMKSFAAHPGLTRSSAVAAFVEREFVQDPRRPTPRTTRPPTAGPGTSAMPPAFPFARGTIALDAPARDR